MLTNMCCGLLGADPSVALGGQALSIMREDSSCVWEAQKGARAELEGVRPPETVIQIAIRTPQAAHGHRSLPGSTPKGSHVLL